MADLRWSKLEPQGNPPISRGYHTSNLVGSKLVVYGGSDGHECFSDVHILDLGKCASTLFHITMTIDERKMLYHDLIPVQLLCRAKHVETSGFRSFYSPIIAYGFTSRLLSFCRGGPRR
jgi:hypothetical protein